MQNEFNFKSISYFQCTKTQTLEGANQGSMDREAQGRLDLGHFPQWAEMIEELSGFSHIWLVFVFHQHLGRWKPKVWPPRSEKKVGVFASRSPYRPNSIGISVVKLESIEKSTIFVSGHDLIDQTPILDIKPYLSYADSMKDSTLGWTQNCKEFQVLFSKRVLEQLDFLKQQGIFEFQSVLEQQLRFHPTDHRRKRVKRLESSLQRVYPHFEFSYRTWRADFELDLEHLTLNVFDIRSGYSIKDLNDLKDTYGDRDIHNNFIRAYKICLNELL